MSSFSYYGNKFLHIFYFCGKVVHFNGCFCRFRTFVSKFTSGTVKSVLLTIHRQNTENNRYVTIRIKRRNTLCDRLTYIIKMRCTSTDNTAKYYNRIIERRLYQLRCRCFCPGEMKNKDYPKPERCGILYSE